MVVFAVAIWIGQSCSDDLREDGRNIQHVRMHQGRLMKGDVGTGPWLEVVNGWYGNANGLVVTFIRFPIIHLLITLSYDRLIDLRSTGF